MLSKNGQIRITSFRWTDTPRARCGKRRTLNSLNCFFEKQLNTYAIVYSGFFSEQEKDNHCGYYYDNSNFAGADEKSD